MYRTTILIAAASGMFIAVLLWPRTVARTSGPLLNDVYVWQRTWNETLDQAVAEHAGPFTEFVALTAEVRWQNRKPRVTRVSLNHAALRNTGRSAGLALRIGPYPGPFSIDDEKTGYLTELASSLLAEASTNQLRVAELQIDFDCAESKLDGYRVWIEAIRRRVAPIPVTITALPAWLKRPAFRRLIAATDGYVLQVHSLAWPRDAAAPFNLCDPAEARRAVERAARLGKSFRVALPTYGYVVALDAAGHFAGLSAEEPDKVSPAGTRYREIRTDPKAMAELVAGWRNDRPQPLRGIIWYRLPVPGDSLNWRWTTLASVMEGNVPHPELRAETRRPQPELTEVDLVNAGQADCPLPARVALRWREARLVSADSLRGFDLEEEGSNSVRFSSRGNGARIEAGQRRTIGWVRLNQKAEVQIELETNPR